MKGMITSTSQCLHNPQGAVVGRSKSTHPLRRSLHQYVTNTRQPTYSARSSTRLFDQLFLFLHSLHSNIHNTVCRPIVRVSTWAEKRLSKHNKTWLFNLPVFLFAVLIFVCLSVSLSSVTQCLHFHFHQCSPTFRLLLSYNIIISLYPWWVFSN